MNKSRLAVLIIVGLSIAMAVAARVYYNQSGTQRDLASLDCRVLLPTAFEFQKNRVMMGNEQTCELARTLATLEPNGVSLVEEEGDPWHYFGRLRLRTNDDVWFLVFIARRSNDYRPIFSLRRQRGTGWAVVGQFDAEPVLRHLGLYDRIDHAWLRSDSSLVPTDQRTQM